MKKINTSNVKIQKYAIRTSNKFDKQLRKMAKQGKDISRIIDVINSLANGEKLNKKYYDHILIDNKYFSNCRECHIGPDWILIYKYSHNELVLYLISTGSHSDLFK